jgi:uncharacterized cupredoxin-like copper-binding protein
MVRSDRARRWRAPLGVLLGMSLVVSACGDDDAEEGTASSADTGAEETEDTTAGEETETDSEAEGEGASIRVLDVVATGEEGEDGTMTHRFEPLEDVTAGPAQLNLVNEGMEPHHVQLLKLNEGVTMDDVGAALATGNPGALLEIGAFAGGTGLVDPGSESTADALVDLEEGTYVMLCFIEGPDGLPHVAKGMVEAFEVRPADGDAGELPEPDVTVNMIDFGFDANELPSSGVVELVNASETQAHEMTLLRMAEGKTGQDVASFFEGEAPGPPPFSGVGGMQALMPGASQLLVLEEAEPGDYLMICLIPDPADGVPHAAKGMSLPATVG